MGIIYDIPSLDEGEIHEDSFVDEHIFPILSMNPWYWDIIVYLQTLKVPSHLSRDESRRVTNNYLIVDNNLYHRGVDSILCCWLTHEEDELKWINVSHNQSLVKRYVMPQTLDHMDDS